MKLYAGTLLIIGYSLIIIKILIMSQSAEKYIKFSTIICFITIKYSQMIESLVILIFFGNVLFFFPILLNHNFTCMLNEIRLDYF